MEAGKALVILCILCRSKPIQLLNAAPANQSTLAALRSTEHQKFGRALSFVVDITKTFHPNLSLQKYPHVSSHPPTETQYPSFTMVQLEEVEDQELDQAQPGPIDDTAYDSADFTDTGTSSQFLNPTPASRRSATIAQRTT